MRKVEDFVCRINVLFSPVSSHGLFSITVTCVEVAVSASPFRIGTFAMMS